MNKDVIYIDVEDDITAIIGKVKASKEKVVALVPPKRVGVLQSAVNLRLLGRAAKQGDKHLVLITNDAALIALSAAAKLPVAKNLQSKPEIAEISALEIDDGDDIIDGSQLPIGELAKTADEPVESDADRALEGIDIADTPSRTKKAAPPVAGALPARPKARSGSKVPNFNRFRKKLVLIILGGILLLGFLIWAIFFAARATVVITAKTSSEGLSQTVSLATSAVDAEKADTLLAVKQEQKKKESVEFEATGKENRGEKATGTVEFSTNSATFLQQGGTIPAGTELNSSSGKTFTTDSSVTLSLAQLNGTTGVTANERGSSYNAADGEMNGAPNGVHAELTNPTSGGTDKNVNIVTASDVQKAATELADKEDADMKSQLQAAFGKGVKVIDTSYQVSKSDPVPSPAVGDVASGTATLTTTITYSMFGVSESELSDFLDKTLAEQIKDSTDQRAYDNGAKEAVFTDFSTKDGDSSAKITATGQVGPKINDDDIKNQVKGKRYGDVQSQLEAISGVDDVDVKFYPFWVNSVPNDAKRISIEFKLNESK